MENLDQILEGLLFVAGDPVDKSMIIEKLNVDKKELDEAVELLKKKYDKESSGINLVCVKNKLQLSSNSKFAEPISVVINPIKEKKLSKSTLEVAAIVAYKQPITRLEIEEIRGVNSDYAIQTLMENEIIAVVGRKDAIGRPLLFGTTDNFLKRFELENLDQLPDYNELLESIKSIESFDNSLYNNFEIPDEDTSNEIDLESANEAINSGDLELSEDKNKKSEKVEVVSNDMTLEEKANQEALENELSNAEVIEADDVPLEQISLDEESTENVLDKETSKELENEPKTDTETNEPEQIEDFDFEGLDNEIPDFLKGEDIEIID